MSKPRTTMATALAVLLLLTAATCDDREPDDTTQGQDQIPSAVRRVSMPVPAGTPSPFIEFVSRDVGYALYYRCADGGEDCPSTVFGTGDGGASWYPIDHPTRGYLQLYATPDILLLMDEQERHYVSTDRGKTFTHSTDRHIGYRIGGEYFRPDAESGVYRWVDGRAEYLPVQPPLTTVDLVAGGADGRVWAAALVDGVPRVAFSPDRGANWSETPVPAQQPAPQMLRLQVSADGRDAWLIASADRFAFPQLWLFAAGRWLPVTALGHPPGGLSVAPLGGGAVAVSGPTGVGLVAEGSYLPLTWPLKPDAWLSVLPDGTLFTRQDSPSRAWLGVGTGAVRAWIELELVAG